MTDDHPLIFTAPHVKRATASERVVPSVTLRGHGDITGIQIENAPLPEGLPADEVEVDVYYCGLNFTDNYLRLGIIRNTNFPVIMGSECVGIITRVGADVTDLKVGHRVLCLRMHSGLFRHIVHVPQRNCFLIPDQVPLLDSIGMGLNFLMANLCLFEFGNLKEGQLVFMESIAGGIGTAVSQLARTVPGVTVVGTASQIKHANAAQLGTDRVFLHKENYDDVIRTRWPRGVHIIINSSGGSHMEKFSQLLRPGGKLINIGSNSTAVYPETRIWGFQRPKWDTKYVSTTDLIKRCHSVSGVNIGSLLETEQEKLRHLLTDIYTLLLKGKIRSNVDTLLPFEEVSDAFMQLCTRGNCGKIVLRVKMETEPPASVVAHVDIKDLQLPPHQAEETSDGSCADGKSGEAKAADAGIQAADAEIQAVTESIQAAEERIQAAEERIQAAEERIQAAEEGIQAAVAGLQAAKDVSDRLDVLE